MQETDVNVPLIVRGPGVPEGKTLDIVTSHTDLAPTFLSLAGTTREGLDGRPIPHKLEEAKKDDKNEHAAIEYWGRVSIHSLLSAKNVANLYRLSRRESMASSAKKATRKATATARIPIKLSD